MFSEKITQRAKNVLLEVSKPSKATKKPLLKDLKVPVASFLDAILAQEGMGALLLEEFNSFAYEADAKLYLSEVLEQAFIEAVELKHPYVGTEHILLAIFNLLKIKEYKSLQKRVTTLGTYPQTTKKATNTAKKTPILDAFGLNINSVYEEGALPELVDRAEVAHIISVLLQRKSANPLLVGDSGIGKASLVRLISKKIANYEVPAALLNTQIIDFDLNGFLGSVLGRETLEASLNALHDEIISSGDVVLFISDIQNVFTPPMGGFMPSFAGNLFASLILDEGIQVIASTPASAYQKYLSENDTINKNFTVVKVKESSLDVTMEILNKKAAVLEKFHKIKISPEVIQDTYKYADKYMKNKRFPQKGIELLDKASALMLYEQTMLPSEFGDLKKKKTVLNESLNKAIQAKNLDEAVKIKKKIEAVDKSLRSINPKVSTLTLTADYLAQALSHELNIPLGRLDAKEKNEFLLLENTLKSRIVGQDKAIKALSTALLRARLGLTPRKRPVGTFLFLGPTGVGKTELAKVLSEDVFGPDSLIKLDMSDFAEKHTVSRLVGAPPGYIGFNEGGELTEKISKNPYSVVLFDEIEKSHPDVLNILLQIMEDGTLVDGKGKAYDFTHSIVILTSNLGSELVNKGSLGFQISGFDVAGSTRDLASKDAVPKDLSSNVVTPEDKVTEAKLLTNLKDILKPELLNRLDEIIVFRKLTKEDTKEILEIMLTELTAILKEKKIKISFNVAAKEFLLQKGYSDEYGARELRRFINRSVVDELASLMIREDLEAPAVVKVGVKKDGKVATGLDFAIVKA